MKHLFQCEVCGFAHDDEARALRCELATIIPPKFANGEMVWIYHRYGPWAQFKIVISRIVPMYDSVPLDHRADVFDDWIAINQFHERCYQLDREWRYSKDDDGYCSKCSEAELIKFQKERREFEAGDSQ